MDLSGLWQEKLKKLTEEIYAYCLKELKTGIPNAGEEMSISLSDFPVNSRSAVIDEVIYRLEFLGFRARCQYVCGISPRKYELLVYIPKGHVRQVIHSPNYDQLSCWECLKTLFG